MPIISIYIYIGTFVANIVAGIIFVKKGEFIGGTLILLLFVGHMAARILWRVSPLVNFPLVMLVSFAGFIIALVILYLFDRKSLKGDRNKPD